MAPRNKPISTQDLLRWEGSIPTYNVYTYGVAGERFFREIKDNAQFMATYCASCQLAYLPPKAYCERCLGILTDWRTVPNRGRVYTFTLSWLNLDGERLEEPEIIAFVQFEGVQGGIVHRLGEVEPDKVSMGMAVKAVFLSKGRRKGSIKDIRYFAPVQK